MMDDWRLIIGIALIAPAVSLIVLNLSIAAYYWIKIKGGAENG